ncbi:MAG: hypothetical protein ABW199_12265, partial [Caulobacterales bacterium]
MVAIFTGLGAGFERGSGASLGAGGLLGGSSLGRGGENVFLNAATGNLLVSRQDEFLVGKGPDLSIARTYNSLGALDDNGDYWRQSTDRRVFGLTGTVNTSGSTIKRVSADGSEITYAWNTSLSAYVTPEGAGAFDTLSYNSGADKWTWTDGSSQITETYSLSSTGLWRITKQTDTDGNELTFAYVSGSPEKLETVTTQDGSYTKYTWSGAHIASIETGYTNLATSASVVRTLTTYGYDGSDRLTSVTVDLTPDNTGDSSTYVTTYTYDSTSNRIATITQTDGSSLTISYDGSNRVIQLVQAVASGDTRTTTISYQSGYTEITDPRGQVTRLTYDSNKQLTQVLAPPAYTGATAQEINYTYDSDGNVLTVVAKQGSTTTSTTTYAYDTNGNVASITDANSNVTTRSYDSKNSLTLETRTGSYAGGASVSLYSRYVYDSENHLRYVVSPEGQVTEYRYTSAGALEYAITYPDDAYTIGSTGLSEATMNSWRDGLSDRATTQIVKNVYDARDNLADSYGYGAASSAGVESTSEGNRHTHYVYDHAGRLLSRYTEPQTSGIAETFVYDGLGRLTGSTDFAGGTVTIAFNDAALTTTITTSQGLTSVSTFNKAGELISKADSGSYVNGGTASNLYDKNGQLRKTTDASGRSSYFLYDKAGRKIADIGHDGQLIEYRYDAAGRISTTIHYNTKISSSNVTALSTVTTEIEIASIRPADNTYDLWQWNIYDAGGRVIETIAGDGSATTYEYDAANRLIKTIGYFNKIAGATVTGFKTTPPTTQSLPTASSTNDVVVRSFYDRDGKLIGALNGEGGLSTITYDKAGRKIEETAYANLTNSTYRASGTFDQLKGSITADTAKDVTSRYVYDGQGLLRFTIDPLRRVTEYVYWEGSGANATANGQVRRTISYAAPLGSVGNYKYATIKDAVTSGLSDRTSYNVYNDRGQLAYSVDAAGGVVGFGYDAYGNVIKQTQFATVATMSSMGASTAWKGNLDTWASSNGTGARITRTYYNAAGPASFTVDA